MKIKQYLLNEVKVKGGYNPVTLVIGYTEAKKLGVEKDVENIYLITTPLPLEERKTNIKEWKKDGSQLVLSTKISEKKYRKKVEQIIVQKYGAP